MYETQSLFLSCTCFYPLLSFLFSLFQKEAMKDIIVKYVLSFALSALKPSSFLFPSRLSYFPFSLPFRYSVSLYFCKRETYECSYLFSFSCLRFRFPFMPFCLPFGLSLLVLLTYSWFLFFLCFFRFPLFVASFMSNDFEIYLDAAPFRSVPVYLCVCLFIGLFVPVCFYPAPSLLLSTSLL